MPLANEVNKGEKKLEKNQKIYRPIAFIAITFAVTWICAVFMAYQTWFSYNTVLGWAVLMLLDFLKSASPLLAALVLWRKPLFAERQLFNYLFGDKLKVLPYMIVLFLFIFQFFTFFLFGVSNEPISVTAFLTTWVGQILLGGGMEEGGWRGYLQPAFEKKVHITVSVIMVGLVWAVWHLPYFFLPGTFASGSNFFMYMVTTTATAFTLTAMYKLTGSVLLCTLFHGWQNAIVMTIPPNMEHPGFLIMFVLQTIFSIMLCVKPLGNVKQID